MKKYFVILLIFSAIHSLHAQDTLKDNSLIMAAWHNDASAVLTWLDRGANVNAQTEEGVTPLMYAAENGDTAVIALLISRGADVNIKPYDGFSALMSACLFNHLDAAIMLIENGADINALNMYGATSLMIASAYGYYIMTDMLLFYGANTELKDGAGNTALIIAATHGFSAITGLLLSKGAQVNAQDENGYTPLMATVINGHVAIADTLLNNNADVNIIDNKGFTALMMAIRAKNDTLIGMLSQAPYNRTIRNKYGQSAADVALINGERCLYHCLKRDSTTKIWPYFSTVSIKTAFTGAWKDILWGYALGINDTRYGIQFVFGHDIRLGEKKILIHAGNEEYNQLNEKRQYVYLGMSKKIALTAIGKGSFGLTPHIQLAYTKGHTGGSYYKPQTGYKFIPGLGLYYKNGLFGCDLTYRYIKTNTWKLLPHYISLGISLDINLRKNPVHKKNIYWIY